ncbi:MAG: glycerol-3-phosphate 1-O-acyltransferase PlsY [Legionellales bacterium]|nr:glycerol-3-phosphate 1-O-acyltransferase PlsY [Legionellales bacterium]
MLTFILLIVAYLIGSFSTAILVCRLRGLPDPRTQGSQNAGATNVLRLGGKSAATWVLVGDLGKGLLAVGLARLLGVSDLALGFVGLAAVLGHIFPIFYQLKGGKGVATALGAMIGLNVILGAVVALIWLAIAKFSRYASAASLIALLCAPWLSLLITNKPYFIPLFMISLLVLLMHWSNITRLIEGSESKIDSNHDKNDPS